LLNEENYFGLFMLSRGVYDLRKIPLQEYYKKVMDLTDRRYCPEWMEFDNFYLFKSKDLKKDVTYEMVPYDHLIDLSSCLSMSYVEGNNFGIKFEYVDKYLVLFFRNIIECTKFYIYGKILHYN